MSTTGARALMQTLVDGGVTACFTNPGTSEMHFVAALDTQPAMRGVLCLFEGVATGAADGYARMAGRPAATLLHLGPGLGNGLANLHNARKGRVPLVNIVGDHATYHVPFDAQLQSDIETAARNVSDWVRTTGSPAELGADAAEAIRVAQGPPGQVATLILPADVSWSDGATPASAADTAPIPGPVAEDATITTIAAALRSGEPAALLLGGRALSGAALEAAGRVSAATGARLLGEVFPTRIERGAGLVGVERIAYLAELAAVQLTGLRHLILVDAKSPVTFFAYPGKASDLVPDGCAVHTLSSFGDDTLGSLQSLVDALGAGGVEPARVPAARPARPTGRLTADKVCQAVAAALPEGAIVSDEAQTSGLKFAAISRGCPRHHVLALTGGAIGQGLPVAVGAAVACPDRPVIALEADGSAMYTIQALWTMAREGLDITVVLFNNRSYAILNLELQRTGAENRGPKALSQLDLAEPALDFVAIARGLGVPAVRARTSAAFSREFERALAEPGPHLIEAIVPSQYTGLRLKALPKVLSLLERLPPGAAQKVKDAVYPG